MTLDADRWGALAPHIDKLLQLPPEARAPWLEVLARTEPGTADRLRELLHARDAASAASFLGGVADPSVVPVGASPGEALGAWTLVEPVGEGGMGSVWRARRTDGRFEGEAAIKLLRAGLFHPSAQARFRHEGAVLARLRHPGIAQLQDAGVSPRGQPYLVLEFVAGERIDAWCDAHALSLAERVDLLARVADAVTAAHAQLVIHRDLKPSNILVNAAGEPKLLDFGIARFADGGDGDGAALTREGAFALTPEYAAPEQFRREPLTVSTDVYALGVLLHEILVGVHPSGLVHGSALDYMKAASDGLRTAPSVTCKRELPGHSSAAQRATARGTTPRLLAAGLAGDLDLILGRALAARPGERYPSMQEFAADLRRHLRSEPVSARAPDLAYRLGKLLRRRPLESGLVAAVALAILVGLVATIWQWRVAEKQRVAADRERARAERMLVRALVAHDFTHTLMSDLAQVPHPVRFLDVLERGERLALDDAAGDPAQRARVLLEIADFRLTGEDSARAGPLAQRAVALALASGDPPLAAIATCDHALALAEEGRGDAADTEVSGALALAGDDPEAIARCYTARGWAASTGGRGAQTLEYARRAADAQARMPWTSTATRVELLDLRANGETLVGDLSAAESHFRAALRLLDEARLGAGLQAAAVWNNLANNFDSQGRLPESLEAYRRALQNSRDILGDEAVPVANWTNLGRTLARLDQYDEAWSVTERGLQAAQRAHDGIAQFYGPITLATIRREQRRFAEARDQLALAHRHLGDEKPGSTLHSALDLAEVREALAEGRAGESLVLLDRLQAGIEAYEREQRTREVTDLFSQQMLFVRAEVMADLGRLPEALSMARQSVAAARRQQGTAGQSADTAAALALVARLQARAGDARGAAATATEAVPQLAATYGATHPLTRRTQTLISSEPAP